MKDRLKLESLSALLFERVDDRSQRAGLELACVSWGKKGGRNKSETGYQAVVKYTNKPRPPLPAKVREIAVTAGCPIWRALIQGLGGGQH